MLTKGKKLFIKSLLVFIFLLCIIYIIIGSNIHDIFIKNYMFETKEVVYLDKVYTSGILDWQILRNHIIIGIICIFIITFYINYIFFQNENKNFINNLTQRIIDIRNGKEVEDKMEFISVDREIEEIIKLKNDLSEKIKAQFIEYNQDMMFLAHDLKTPLTAIIGYTNLLIDNPELDDQKRNKYLEIVLDSSYQLENLINKFFELSEYSVQSDLLTTQNIKLEDIIIEIQESLYVERKEHDIIFRNNLEDNVFIDVNSELFARALMNIYRNAVKYADRGTEIITNLIVNNQDRITLSISNKFSNLNTIDVNKIFNTFYRGENSDNGSGLGLSIAKTIIEKQGGTIKAFKENKELTIVVEI